MKFDLIALEKEVAAGNVSKQAHPELPLFIYKYTNSCVYAGNWNDITLKCRGLVLDELGNVVINPMPKFFNHNETLGEEILNKNLGQSFVVTDKLDGSMINVAVWNDVLVVASSGSFVSAQANKARQMIEKLHFDFLPGLTYVLEIIYPENRIVLNYGDKESLTLLTLRITDSGADLGKVLKYSNYFSSFPLVQKVYLSIDEILKDLNRKDFINKEGFVVQFENGERVKFKYLEYLRLHKIVSGVNEKFVWECLRDNINFNDILQNVPDELFDFVQKTSDELLEKFGQVKNKVKLALESVSVLESRKDKALYLKQFWPDVARFVFLILDNKDPKKEIWGSLEPKISSKFGCGELTSTENEV